MLCYEIMLNLPQKISLLLTLFNVERKSSYCISETKYKKIANLNRLRNDYFLKAIKEVE